MTIPHVAAWLPKLSLQDEACAAWLKQFRAKALTSRSVFTFENVNNDLPEVRDMFVEDHNHRLHNIEITQDIVSSKLSELKKNKAPGAHAWF